MYFLSIGSLVLGLVACILPIINLVKCKKTNYDNWATLSILSISGCAISLYFQIFYYNNLVIDLTSFHQGFLYKFSSLKLLAIK